MIFENKKYIIEFDKKGAIASLESGGKQFVKQRLPLFQFCLRNKGETQILTSDDAESVNLKQNGDFVKFEFVFKKPHITFDVNLCCNDRITATFSFENNTGVYVEWVDFVQLTVPNDLVSTGGSGRGAIDTNEGMLVEDIKLKENFYPYKYRPLDYPSEGLYAMFPAVVQSQFLSYYDDTAGIYMAVEDRDRSIRVLILVPWKMQLSCNLNFIPVLKRQIKILICLLMWLLIFLRVTGTSIIRC